MSNNKNFIVKNSLEVNGDNSNIIGTTVAGLRHKNDLYFDFANDVYRNKDGLNTFDSLVDHSRSSNATMVDSDGILKWAPHNLVLNSESPASQTITVEVNAKYTVEMMGSGSITLSDAGSGTVTQGSSLEITASTTSLTLTVSGSIQKMWAYRSDLGGMVNNPDSGNSYVPTTSSVRYLPRRGHHVYDSDLEEWVNKGILYESEARTNLATHSDDLSTWEYNDDNNRGVIVSDQAVGPDGQVSLDKFNIRDPGGSGKILGQRINYTADNVITLSAFFLEGEYRHCGLKLLTSENNWASVTFDLRTGSNTQSTAGATSGTIHDSGAINYGGGLYRIWASLSVSETDTDASVLLEIRSSATPSLNVFGANNFIGAVGEGIYVGFAQIEQAPTPSSYIPTNGSQVTRAADSLTIPAANLPYSSTAMSIAMKGEVTYDTSRQNLMSWGVQERRIEFSLKNSDPMLALDNRLGDGTNAYPESSNLPYGVQIPFNIAARCDGSVGAISAQGSPATSRGPASIPDLTPYDLGFNTGIYSAWAGFMGTISRFNMWGGSALNDPELEKITSTKPQIIGIPTLEIN